MRTLGIPDAADIAERLEAIEGDPMFGEPLARRKMLGLGTAVAALGLFALS